jgi:aspartyl-tRNA(Asn)/glutamyl-tRNA(Gln) amidotransferase subunit A
VPAALCGLAGYRSTLGLGGEEAWQGGWHLAASFDTLGWLFRDLRDGPVLAAALLGVKPVAAPKDVIVAAVAGPYLDDCEPAVRDVYNRWQETLRDGGAQIEAFTPDFWEDSREIFGGIQGHEAAAIHRGNFEHFEKTITERLTWGGSLSAATIEDLRRRHVIFRARMDHLLEQYDFLMLPCAPMSALHAGVDHSESRLHILRYTTPISLAGMPAVVLAAPGGGVQLVGARGSDARLLAFAASLKAGNATLPS